MASQNSHEVDKTRCIAVSNSEATPLAPLSPDQLCAAILSGSCSDNDLKDFISHLDKALPPEQLVLDLLCASSLRNFRLPNAAPVKRSQDHATSGYTRRIVVVGDLHGQFRDLLTILNQDHIGGMPSSSNTLIFNGDLVDRGDMSVEILIALLAIQNTHKDSVLILRGNHETTDMNSDFGFEEEVLKKYNGEVLQKFRAWFHSFPFTAVIEDSVFVCHGGLGPSSQKMTIAEINTLNRYKEPALDTPMYELMWCDPSEDAGMKVGPVRAYRFGRDITESFLALNDLDLIIRSHECCRAGYRLNHSAQCITVFSAANYCGSMTNAGAVVVFDAVDSMEPNIVTFEAAHYPLPDSAWDPWIFAILAPASTPAVVSPPHSPQSVARATSFLTPAVKTDLTCGLGSPTLRTEWQSESFGATEPRPPKASRRSSSIVKRKAAGSFSAWLRSGPRSPGRCLRKKKVC